MATRSPQDTLDALGQAWAARDWQAVAELFDPDDMSAFRNREVAVLTDRAAIYAEARREGRQVSGWGSDAILDPGKLAAFGSEPQAPFSGTPTLTDLAARSPRDFFIACLEAQAAAGERFAERAKSRGMTVGIERESAPTREVIGEVTEGVDLVHILFRWPQASNDDHPTHVHVRTLRRSGGEWRVCLDHELRMMVSPMSAFAAFE